MGLEKERKSKKCAKEGEAVFVKKNKHVKSEKAQRKNEKHNPLAVKKKKKSKEQREKQLRTSSDIINRIKWDTGLSKHKDEFIVGYLDRFLGIMEATIDAFEEENLIPYHRIYYIKYHKKVVWDRKKRRDFVSNNKILKYVERYENEGNEEYVPSESSSESDSDDNDYDTNETNKQDEEEMTMLDAALGTNTQQQGSNSQGVVSQTGNDEPNEKGLIVLSQNKNRRIYKQYVPQDALESWMVEINDREKALSDTTHISMKGGLYNLNVFDKEMYKTYLTKWNQSIQENNQNNFYIEEWRQDTTRLYIDIDVKSRFDESVDIIKMGWIEFIAVFTRVFFSESDGLEKNELDCSMVVSECHAPWTDKSIISTKYKSGYRVYFTCIYVDMDTLERYTKRLGEELKEMLTDTFEEKGYYYEGQPSAWKFEDIIDYKNCSHKKARLLGTVKNRRGKILKRVYTVVGYFNGKNGTIDALNTNLLKKNYINLLHYLSVIYHSEYECKEGGAEKTILAIVFKSQNDKLQVSEKKYFPFLLYN